MHTCGEMGFLKGVKNLSDMCKTFLRLELCTGLLAMCKTFWEDARVPLGVHFGGPAGVLYRVSYSHNCRVFTLPADVQNYVQNFFGVRQGSAGGPFWGFG